MLANYEKHREFYHEFSPINHVTPGDPPVFLLYSQSAALPATSSGHGIHHPMFGFKLKEVCDAAGVECHLVVGGAELSGPQKSSAEFLMKKLLKK